VSRGVQKIREQIELLKRGEKRVTPYALDFEVAETDGSKWIFRVPVVEETQATRYEFVCVWTGPNLAGAAHPTPADWEAWQVEPKTKTIRVWEPKK
jgi:hypothetical protein